MRRRRLISAVVLAGVIAGVIAGVTPWETAGAQDGRGGRRGQPPRPQVLDRAFEWSGELARGQRVVIRSLVGNIRVQPATGKTLDIVARKIWRRGSPENVKIDATRINEGRDVLVCARWNASTTCTESDYSTSGGDIDANEVVAVELMVMLPAGTHATIATTIGDIIVNGASGDLRAFTTTGRIRLETTETVLRAETTAGDVRVQMAKLPEQGARYAAVTGPVYVTLPDGVNASIDARTVMGEISTEFAIAVQGAFSTKQLRGTVGKGGPKLTIETVMGSVRIQKQ